MSNYKQINTMDKKQEYVAPKMDILDVELESSILTASSVIIMANDWDDESDDQY